MNKKIVTISREFGSGGRYIGKEIAKRTGFSFYDNEIITKAAQNTGLSEKYIREMGEYSPKKGLFSFAFVGRNSQGASLGDMMYAAQREIILEVTKKEPCVIVGRCADYILRDREDCFHVFICGNEMEKKQRLKELYDFTEEEVLHKMKDMDKKRSTHYHYYTDRTWGEARNYMLALNSSEIGYEKCIEIILDCIK